MCSSALRDLARAARARSHAKVIAVTGSVGKTSTKEALLLALAADGETHASAASYNNHWGVPLSLARCPANAKYAVFEIGMNHAGEITPLTKLVRPHVAIVTTIAPVHLEYFGSLKKIADAKAEIFLGLELGGVAVLNRDNRQFMQLAKAAAAAGAARIVSFGDQPRPTRGCCAIRCRRKARPSRRASWASRSPTSSARRASIWCSIRSPCWPPLALVGADLALAALALNNLKPAAGRGVRASLRVPGGSALSDRRELQRQPGLDGGRHRAARPGPGRRPRPPHCRPGRHAGTGRQGPALHRGLGRADRSGRHRPGVLQRALMHALWEALPSGRRGGYAETAAALEPAVLAAIRAGDAVMVKGSLGSKMGPIVKALERQFARPAALEQAPAQALDRRSRAGMKERQDFARCFIG